MISLSELFTADFQPHRAVAVSDSTLYDDVVLPLDDPELKGERVVSSILRKRSSWNSVFG
jgi:hypothetical protein